MLDGQTTMLDFDGADYIPKYDQERLTGQLLEIFEFMSDQGWHTLKEISESTGSPEASASAQLRNLRKTRFGGYIIERKRSENRESGLYYYRLNINLKRK